MKRTKLFILDTNTLLSAFLLSPNTITAQAYYRAKTNGQIILSKDTLTEFTNVFIRPKFDRYLTLYKRLTIIGDLNEVIKVITVTSIITACRGPKDNKF